MPARRTRAPRAARTDAPAPAPAPGPLRVASLEQVRLLAHPLRLRLLEAFAEPRTTKQVADLLGERPTRLYHHVDALAAAGLLALEHTRPNRGTTEKYFRTVSHRIEFDARVFGDSVTGVSSRIAGAVLGNHDALAARLARVPRELTGIPLLARAVMGLTRDQARALHGELLHLLERCRELKTPAPAAEAHTRWALSIAFAPEDLAADHRPRVATPRRRGR